MLTDLAAQEAGSFARKCASLGMSAGECLYAAWFVFEESKKKFIGPGGPTIELNIPGRPGSAEARWLVAITRSVTWYTMSNASRADIAYSEVMLSLFDPVVDEIISHIEAHLELDDKIKTVVVPGGFGKSKYLRRRLMDRFGTKVNIEGEAQLNVNR